MNQLVFKRDTIHTTHDLGMILTLNAPLNGMVNVKNALMWAHINGPNVVSTELHM